MFKFVLLFLFSSTTLYLTLHPEHSQYITYLFNPKTKFSPLIISSDSIDTHSVQNDTGKVFNFNYRYKFSPLGIDNTDTLNLSHYKCKPISFGYSVSDGKAVFPDFEYPSCSLYTGVKNSQVNLNRTKNSLRLKCKSTEQGYFFAGPIKGFNLMKFDRAVKFPIHHYKKPISARNIEYALAFCCNETLNTTDDQSRNKIDKTLVQHASMAPLFNETLYNNSLKMLKKKPRIIFMLTLDSFSRRHFYRKLPKLVNFLNQSQKLLPKVAVYDFLMQSTFSSKSITNQGPIFGGTSYKKHRRPIGKDKIGKDSMWTFFKEQGYITFMGMDDCDPDFPAFLGDNINVDYSVRQFYCLAQQYSTFHSAKNFSEQRCIGPHMSHFYVLNYTLELLRMYKGANMWIYLHLNAAHEKTGQHGGTLDSILVKFLTHYFQITSQVADTFMFLQADHGMRYGDWYTKVESYQETKLPSMFILASKSLLNKYLYSFYCLNENTKRLVSKLDIRKTIYYLGGKELNMTYAVNLIDDVASYNRDCKQMLINPLYCACSTLSQLNPNGSPFPSLVNIIRIQVEKIMNNETYNIPKYPQGKFCDQVILDKVFDLYHLEVDSEQEIYQIEFGSSKFLNMKLQVNFVVSRNTDQFNKKNSAFRPFLFHSDNGLLLVKVIEI